MSEQEALEHYRKLFHGNMSPRNDDYGNRDAGFRNGWQAAIEYKQEEIEALENTNNLQSTIISSAGDAFIKLQAENKNLREALKWYADRKNCDNPDFAHVEIDRDGEEIADGGYKAREALKEMGEE